MPTRKAPQPTTKIEDMTDLEASFEAAIAEAERDGRLYQRGRIQTPCEKVV